MSRYAEIGAMIERVKRRIEIHKHRKEEYEKNEFWDWSKGIEQEKNAIREAENDLELLESLPTADVVEVVRCKDCEYYHPSYCEIWSKQTREPGFCYMGMHNYNWGADMKGETNGFNSETGCD